MNIALTGGTGFLGSHFLKQALEAGHNVLAIRRSPCSKPRIPITQNPQWLDRQLDEVTAEELLGCEVLVHLASHSVQYPYDNLFNCLHWNLMAVLSLFEQARLAGIQRYIVAGSCFEYGRSGEDYDAIPANAPLEPTNSYAASKAAASIALRQWAEEHQLNLNILRVFHVYGEGEHPTRLWPSLIKAAKEGKDFSLTAGEQVRDFINVVDVARSFLDEAEALLPPASAVTIKNLGSGNRQTIRQFSEYWWKRWEATGCLLVGSLPYRKDEVMKYIPEL